MDGPSWDDCSKAYRLDAAKAALPSGYVIVPRDPTFKMVAAGYRALNACPDKESDIMEPIYEAMIDAGDV